MPTWHEIIALPGKLLSMEERKQPGSPANEANKGRGMQGIDKAPGEEPAQSLDQFVAQTQKGKNKVDGDPSNESDRPLDHQDIND